MTEKKSAENSLSENERMRIRTEMRYAMVAAQEARQSEKPKHGLDKVLGYLSNGFVLLLLGSIITSVLVPHFQRNYERRARQSALMQECLSQFLVYSNSIWQEYYTILPVALEAELNKEAYVRLINHISQIKLKRYDAYAKVQALSIVFRISKDNQKSPIEQALHNYAVSVNTVSQKIDEWLGDLYCTPMRRTKSPCATFNPAFDAYAGYEKIKKLVLEVGNERAQQVTELMVKQIKSPDQ